jgi:RNA polymerase sigma-70 factor (ECF subfamily)
VFYYTVEKLASVTRSNPDPADEELVRQTLDGQPSAYAELVRRWAAPVLAVCHARIRCWHAAEDLAQETLLRGLKALPSLTSRERFGPWLRGIAQRVCLDWLKSKQTGQVPFTSLGRGQAPDELLATDGDAASRELEAAEESRRLMDCVSGLDDDCREVLMLYYYQDVTYADLAELLGVSPATINARLTKARAALREQLRRGEAGTMAAGDGEA